MFGLVGWQVKLAEFVVAAFLCFGAYMYIGHTAVENYKESVAVAQAKADKEQQDKYNALEGKYEALRGTRQENTNTITKTYEKVIEKPIYSVQCIEPSGLLLANQAIAGKPATIPDTKMPSDKTP